MARLRGRCAARSSQDLSSARQRRRRPPILSACNTAGGQAANSEAFSGLARAFFYAGTRALLVSHWAVNSDAAVAITTGTIDAMKTHPDIGRAEALRRSISALITKGGESAQPATWAPFVLVGAGAI